MPNMTGFMKFENDISIAGNYLTSIDTETEVSGTFTITPGNNGVQDVVFKLNGTGTVTYDGSAISSIYDYNDFLYCYRTDQRTVP